MVQIIINGAHGKMGQVCKLALAADPKLNCVAECGSNDDLEEAIKQFNPDVVIDFTTPTSVYDNCRTIINSNARPLIGTSGLTQEQIIELQHLCSEHKLGGLIVPNFSISAVLMLRYATDAGRYFDNVDITELHNITKKDAPSGTAVHTAYAMQETNNKLILQQDPINKKSGISIHSQRTPQQHAMQEVVLHAEYETLTIKNHCFDRKAYMHGIQIACHAIMQLVKLEVGLDKILF